MAVRGTQKKRQVHRYYACLPATVSRNRDIITAA